MLQQKPAAHWPSLVQPPWQPVPLHGTVGLQAMGLWDVQLPPWHVAAGMAAAFGMSPEQDGGTPQLVPFVTAVLQSPPWHVSKVHGFPSTLHEAPFPSVTCEHPVAGTQESVVQLL